MRFDALGLVAFAGTALLCLVETIGPRRLSVVAVRLAMCAAVLVGVATRHHGAGSAAITVVGVAAVVAEVVVARRDRVAWATLAPVGAGGAAVVAAGWLDADTGALVAVLGAATVVAVAVATARVGVVVVPALVLVAAHVLSTRGLSEDVDVAGLGAAVAGAVVAVVAWRARPTRPIWTGPSLALVSFAVALVVVSQDTPELHAAGLLLAGGATLAVAARHPLGLVAFAPGAAAVVDASGTATGWVHAVAAVAVAALVLAATRPNVATVPNFDVRSHWPVVLAAAFAVVPTWGWSGADVGSGYGEAVAVAAATAVIVATVAAAGLLRRRHDRAEGSSTGPHPGGDAAPAASSVPAARR